MKKGKSLMLLRMLTVVSALALCTTACNDDDEQKGVPFDASQPVVAESFAPTTGPLATQVILRGSNFGTDVSQIHVFFNDKEAPVLGSSGDHILVLAPRLPGRYLDDGTVDNHCRITVHVADKTVTFADFFDYQIQTNVTTLVGGDKSATNYPVGGEDLATVQFNKEISKPIVCDSKKNIYFTMDTESDLDSNNPNVVYCINEESGKIRVLERGITGFLGTPYICYDQVRDRCCRFHSNMGGELYYYDRENDFSPMLWFSYSQYKNNVRTIKDAEGNDVENPDWSPEILIEGLNALACKHMFVTRPSDGFWYGRIDQGYFVSINPNTHEMRNISGYYEPNTPNKGSGIGFATKNGECDGMAFDPADDTKLYFTNTGSNSVWLYDFETRRLSVYAGSSSGSAGFMDGQRTQALFDSPRQLCIDKDRNMYIADANNHCIRKIVMATGFVSTVAGQPRQPGYENGTGETALFDTPVGIAVDNDGIIYVGDSRNRAIRRVAIE